MPTTLRGASARRGTACACLFRPSFPRASKPRSRGSFAGSMPEGAGQLRSEQISCPRPGARDAKACSSAGCRSGSTRRRGPRPDRGCFFRAGCRSPRNYRRSIGGWSLCPPPPRPTSDRAGTRPGPLRSSVPRGFSTRVPSPAGFGWAACGQVGIRNERPWVPGPGWDGSSRTRPASMLRWTRTGAAMTRARPRMGGAWLPLRALRMPSTRGRRSPSHPSWRWSRQASATTQADSWALARARLGNSGADSP